MSGPKRGVVVSRSYTPASDKCARALELLLKKRVKEGTRPGAPDDRKGPEHDPAKVSISQ